MFCQHCLATRYDGYTLLESCLDDVVGVVGIVDHLHNEVDLVVLQNIVGAIGQKCRIDCYLTRLAQIADADLDDLGMGVLRLANHLIDSLSDYTEAEKADFNITHRVPNL